MLWDKPQIPATRRSSSAGTSAPRSITTRAATTCATLTAATGSRPASRAARYPPLKLSPAPVVSTGRTPCGACRQWLLELAPAAEVWIDGEPRPIAVAELLPHGFQLA